MEKNATYKALAVALKKKLKTFYYFPDFISIFQTFSSSGKLLDKFQDFSKNSRLCTYARYSCRTSILLCSLVNGQGTMQIIFLLILIYS